MRDEDSISDNRRGIVIIGIGQRKFVGKDTAADYLVAKYGFMRRSFADALKDEVLRTWHKTIIDWSRDEGHTRDLYISKGFVDDDRDFVKWLVYVEKPPFIVSLLQEHGTELRRGDDQYYWIRKLSEWWDTYTDSSDRFFTGHLVIPDVRFENEAGWVLAPYHHGATLLLTRDVDRVVYGRHSSEEPLPKWCWTHEYVNNASIEALYRYLDILMEKYHILPTKGQ